jgi:hypothetical protein
MAEVFRRRTAGASLAFFWTEDGPDVPRGLGLRALFVASSWKMVKLELR